MPRSKVLVEPIFLENHWNNPVRFQSDDVEPVPGKATWRFLTHFLKNLAENNTFLICKDTPTNIDGENPILKKLLDDYWGRISENIKIVKEDETIEADHQQLSLYCFLDKNINDAGINESIVFKSNEVLERWIFNSSNCLLDRQTSWNVFSTKKHYTTTIIIEDAYIFTNKVNIENNFFPLIKNLFSFGNIKTNLLVITNKLYKSDVNETEELIENVHLHILDRMSKVPELKGKINLTIAKVENTNQVHSRLLFTDYFCINFGNSLNWYDNKGNYRLNTSTPVFFLPHAVDTNFNTSSQLIKETKQKLCYANTLQVGEFDLSYFDLW